MHMDLHALGINQPFLVTSYVQLQPNERYTNDFPER